MKVTTPAQRIETALKQLTRLTNKWVAETRKTGIRLGTVDCAFYDNLFTVQIEISDESKCAAKELMQIIESASDLLVAVDSGFTSGTYMWDADSYIRPTIWATFKI